MRSAFGLLGLETEEPKIFPVWSQGFRRKEVCSDLVSHNAPGQASHPLGEMSQVGLHLPYGNDQRNLEPRALLPTLSVRLAVWLAGCLGFFVSLFLALLLALLSPLLLGQ